MAAQETDTSKLFTHVEFQLWLQIFALRFPNDWSTTCLSVPESKSMNFAQAGHLLQENWALYSNCMPEWANSDSGENDN